MSDGMGREFTYLSSHATNRYFIPNWGRLCLQKLTQTLVVVLISAYKQFLMNNGAPDKPCGVGRADANPKLLLNDT